MFGFSPVQLFLHSMMLILLLHPCQQEFHCFDWLLWQLNTTLPPRLLAKQVCTLTEGHPFEASKNDLSTSQCHTLRRKIKNKIVHLLTLVSQPACKNVSVDNFNRKYLILLCWCLLAAISLTWIDAVFHYRSESNKYVHRLWSLSQLVPEK